MDARTFTAVEATFANVRKVDGMKPILDPRELAPLILAYREKKCRNEHPMELRKPIPMSR
jgi:hypothetical protein